MTGKYYFEGIEVESYDGTLESYDFRITLRGNKSPYVYVAKWDYTDYQFRRISLYDPVLGETALSLIKNIELKMGSFKKV